MKFYILGYEREDGIKRFQALTSDVKRREAVNKLRRQRDIERVWVEPEVVNWPLNSIGLEAAFKYAESAHLELGDKDDDAN